MKPHDIKEIVNQLELEGITNEVPVQVLKQYLAEYIGMDKYRMKNTLEMLVELGYFTWIGAHAMKINESARWKKTE